MRHIFLALIFSFAFQEVSQSATPSTNAQLTNNQIASVRLFNLPPKGPVTRHYIEVTLSSDTANDAADLAPTNIDLRTIPSNKQLSGINAGESQFIPGTHKILQIVLDDIAANDPSPGDSQVRITFRAFHFADKIVKDLSAVGKIYDQSNIGSFKDDLLADLKKSVASAKTQSEKDVFAGLNVTVPSGSGDTQGNGDISFNHTFYAANVSQRSLFDQAVFGVQAKKASGKNADPRHFQVGTTARKVFLLANRNDLAAVRDAILTTPAGEATTRTINDPSRPDLSGKKPEEIIRSLQRRFFRAIYFDNGLQFEGDIKGASVGNVSNLVYDGQVQFTTINRQLGNSSSFLNLRLLPIGTDLGHNINNNDNPQVNSPSVIRLNNGIAFNLFYDAPAVLPVKIELSVDAVNRHLFHSESAFDTATQKASLVTSGNKYWIQADAKLFFVHTDHGHAGLRITFQRGFLPPVYSLTKAFNIGLVFETADDDSSKQLKLQ
jgi:hypothetical protein